jgi:hypothetical protein
VGQSAALTGSAKNKNDRNEKTIRWNTIISIVFLYRSNVVTRWVLLRNDLDQPFAADISELSNATDVEIANSIIVQSQLVEALENGRESLPESSYRFDPTTFTLSAELTACTAAGLPLPAP